MYYMLKSKTILETELPAKDREQSENWNVGRYKRLLSIGKISVDIINELDSPIDSTNRFINLALHAIGEDSQSRQFLLESKQGIRKTSSLLKRLTRYAKKIEKEIQQLSENIERRNGENANINSRQR